MKSSVLQARIEPESKQQGKEILEQLGLSESEFLNLAWKQLILRRGVPFEVRIPDEDERQQSISLAGAKEQRQAVA